MISACEVALADKSVGVAQDLGVKTHYRSNRNSRKSISNSITRCKRVGFAAATWWRDTIRVVDKVTGVTSAIVDDEFQIV